jgi:ADP-ribosylglycohydrolase
VLTAAVAKAILEDGDYRAWIREIGRRYPRAGYGGSFSKWLNSNNPEPYNSWGNGAAMRVSPVGFAFGDSETVLREAARTAEITHNHPEGIKGARAAALAVFLARTGAGKEDIKKEITGRFGYDLDPYAGRRQAFLQLRHILPGDRSRGNHRLSRIGIL